MPDLPRRSTVLVTVTLLAGAVGCSGNERGTTDTPVAAERQAEAPPLLPAGTELTFRLTQTLSTSENHAGETFDAVVNRDVVGSARRIIVAAGAPARGQVLRSSEGHGKTPAILALEMETVRVNGEWLPIDATAVAADAQGAEGERSRGSTGRIAIGAEAGALMDQIVRADTLSVPASAGVGAFTGAVVALTIHGRVATLREGSRFRVRLNAPVGTK